MFLFYNGPYSGVNFATKDRTDFAYIYLFIVKSDIIQFPVIKAHNFG